MYKHAFSEMGSLRAEIAAAAARMIVEDGVSYGMAKRKAARYAFGSGRVAREMLPDNAQIEEEVRIYNELFLGETQPARLSHLRELALELMEKLAQFNPYLTGAVLNGTAGEYSEIRLQLFVDNPKDVMIYLLNRGVDFDVSETTHFKQHHAPVETLSFMWKNEGVHLILYETNDFRGALKVKSGERAERAKLEAVKALIAQEIAE